VFRLRGQAMERVTPANGLGYPNGVAVSGDGRSVFVAQGVNLRRIDVATGEVKRVPGPANLSTLGVDGLYWRDGTLIAVQNAGTPGRVLKLALSPEQDRITGHEVLQAGDPGFDIPTTGALAPGRIFVLANAQIDRLKEDGTLDPTKPLAPIRVLEIPLG
jgi:hypothetical protein